MDFVIDTGFISGDELGSIEPKLHQSLLQKSHLRVLGHAECTTAAGTNLTSVGEVDQFKLADTRVDKPVFRAGVSLLGLGFLSRFNVTLDFPNNSMYLRARTNRVAGKRYVLSGISLGSLQGNVVVTHVFSGSREERLGLKVNDVIQQVDQKKVGPSDLFELRQRLNEEGQVSLVIERSKTEHIFKLTLVPPDDSPKSQPVLAK